MRCAFALIVVAASPSLAEPAKKTFPVSIKVAHERLLRQAEFVRCQGKERTICLYRMGEARLETASESPDGNVFSAGTSCHSAAATLNDCATATAFLSGVVGAGFSDDKVFFAIFTAYEEKNARFDETAFVSAGTRLSVLYPLKLADGLRTADYIFTFEKK